jgi:hypothetical protein
MRYFVLVFDHSTGTLLELTEYDDGSEALVAWGRRERRERRRPKLEVRLISARSLEVLKARHPEYFSEGGA